MIPEQLNIIYTNAHSLPSKINDLELVASENKPDFILVTETWCNPSVNQSVLNINDYEVLTELRDDRKDTTNGIGGGLIVFNKKGLVILPGDQSIEFNQYVSFKVKTLDSYVNVFLVYRPPNNSAHNFEKLCELIRSVPNNSIVVGDFNFPHIDWENLTANGQQSTEFLDLCIENNLHQYVSFGTHNRNNILDLVLCNDECIVSINDLGPLGNSDHTMIQIVTNHSIVDEVERTKIFNWFKADKESLKEEVNHVNWDEILTGTSVEDDWNTFKNTLQKICEKHVPTRQPKKKSKPAWATREITKLQRKKVRAYKKMKITRDDSDYQEYKDLEKQLKRAIRSSKRRMEIRISKCTGNEGKKKFTSYVKGKLSIKTGIGPLIDEHNEVIADKEGMANLLNQQFCSVFSTEVGDIPEIRGTRCEKTITDMRINVHEVKRKLDGIKYGKSPGPDNITSNILRMCSESLAEPLCLIFQNSLDTGQVPRDWKLAKVVPIFKKGARGKPSNYRPVSLTSLVGKIMESLIRDKVTDHLITNALINLSQHGFMADRSCQTNLLEFLDKVLELIDEGKPVDIVYLDFSKAFDKVPHQRLLKKLEAHGIKGKLKSWIENWLTGRQQWVEIGGYKSGAGEVKSGVPQGSVLGPLLFIIFINDLDEEIKLDILRKFADDTKGAKSISSVEDKNQLQSALDEFLLWSEKWCMEFNIEKCKIMHCGRNNPSYSYYMDNKKLQEVKEERDIGVSITDNLKPSNQCRQAANRAKAVLAQISKGFHYRDRNVFIRIYKQYVRPHLEFSSSVWSPWFAADIKCIEEIQEKAVRMVSGLQSQDYDERLKELGLWRLEKRRKMADLIQCFKIVNNIGRVSCGMVHVQETGGQNRIQTRSHADPKNLHKHRNNLDIRKNFFTSRVIDWWNALPHEVKHSSNVKMFKSRLVQEMSREGNN